MKKILILAVLMATYSNMFAFLTQSNWRWRSDDGTETTATWKAAQNTPPTLVTQGEVWRLRIEVYNNAGSTLQFSDSLQYATSTGGPWTNIDENAGSNPFKIAGTSAFVTQAEPTTQQFTDPSYPFFPGKIMLDSMLLTNDSLVDGLHTEIEWAIVSTPNITPNTTYYFRLQGITSYVDPTFTDDADTYPYLITAGLLPIKFSGFNVIREGQKAKLNWTIESKQNISKFEVERSSDGKTWKTIANVNEQSIIASNTYTVYDSNPLSGNNYYLIKQYDIDGHSYQSDVKLLKMSGIKSILSVSPNPSHSGISFSIANQGASNVDAKVISINGSVIHHEIIGNVQPNSTYKLNMKQQPAPGVYILKLNAQELSESVKVVVQ